MIVTAAFLRESGFFCVRTIRYTLRTLIFHKGHTMTTPSITFLNMTGDITISWDARNEEAILALVEKKMKEGYSFFILKPRVFGLLGNKKVPVTSLQQAREAGSVMMADQAAEGVLAKLDDADLEAAVAAGKANVVRRTSSSSLDTARRARTAREVVQNPSVGVRRVVGG